MPTNHLDKSVCVCSPEGVPRLFDLVKVKDACFLPVFYFALRDTLVADNLVNKRQGSLTEGLATELSLLLDSSSKLQVFQLKVLLLSMPHTHTFILWSFSRL